MKRKTARTAVLLTAFAALLFATAAAAIAGSTLKPLTDQWNSGDIDQIQKIQ